MLRMPSGRALLPLELSVPRAHGLRHSLPLLDKRGGHARTGREQHQQIQASADAEHRVASLASHASGASAKSLAGSRASASAAELYILQASRAHRLLDFILVFSCVRL